ncbi:MAG: tRNA1(Val) (adenine(37)-N6)-methyltransferase [Myxococcales bacterium]|nr:tRNA1(Val) (adenine(37)-N6)-methyltransferase [Myxococcales bacterium]
MSPRRPRGGCGVPASGGRFGAAFGGSTNSAALGGSMRLSGSVPSASTLAPCDDTRDEILRGRLRLWQPRTGYRFNVDSLLLAHFIAPDPPPDRVCDLCAGVGVIGLALALRWPEARVVLAELQPRMASLARRNIDENGLRERVQVVEVDLGQARRARAALPGASFRLVVSSPPYFTVASGPTVLDAGEAMARHELRMSLADLAREARRLLKPGGRAAVVFPSERLPDLLASLVGEGLRPVRLRAVHPRSSVPANRVLVEAVKGGRGGLVIEPPLVVREEDGGYSAEARSALGEA